MYFIGLLILIVLSALTFFGFSHINYYLNLPSFFIIIILTFPMLYASGLFKEFFTSFKIISSKEKNFTRVEIEKSILSINLAIKLVLLSGLIGSLSGFVALLATLDDPAKIGISLAVSLICLLYSLFGIIFLLPVKAKLKTLLLLED